MVRLARGAVAGHLGIDTGLALERVIERFQDQDAGALPGHEAVAGLLKALAARALVSARKE